MPTLLGTSWIALRARLLLQKTLLPMLSEGSLFLLQTWPSRGKKKTLILNFHFSTFFSTIFICFRFLPLFNCRYWTWDVTNAMQGRCYTIQYDQKLQIEMEKDSLIIDLNKELRLSVFLHQPGFFLLTYNSLTMPTLDLVLDHTEVGDSYLTLMLEVVQHQRLSREHIQKERKTQSVKVCTKHVLSALSPLLNVRIIMWFHILGYTNHDMAPILVTGSWKWS